MWVKSHSIVTQEVSKAQIWALMTDVNHWKNWDPTVENSELLGEFKVGNYFILQPKGGPKVKIKLIEVVKHEKFTDETSFPLAKMYGEHLYEETPEGLKITVTMRVKGLLSFLWVKLVANDIVNNLPQDLCNQIEHAKRIQHEISG